MPGCEATARGRQELLLVANYLIITAFPGLLRAGDVPALGAVVIVGEVIIK